MIKIEITDPHLLSRKILMATAKYVQDIADSLYGTENVFIPTPPFKSEADDQNRMITALPELKDSCLKTSEPLLPPMLASSAISVNTPNPFSKPPVTEPKSKVLLDSQGLPWDDRIHARTKTKSTNGQWKLMRGVDPRLAERIINELKNVYPMPLIEVKNELPIPSSVHSSIPLPPADAILTTSLPPPSETFPTLMNKITDLVAAGKLNHAQVQKACLDVGIPSLPVAASRPDLIPQISRNIDLMM